MLEKVEDRKIPEEAKFIKGQDNVWVIHGEAGEPSNSSTSS